MGQHGKDLPRCRFVPLCKKKSILQMTSLLQIVLPGCCGFPNRNKRASAPTWTHLFFSWMIPGSIFSDPDQRKTLQKARQSHWNLLSFQLSCGRLCALGTLSKQRQGRRSVHWYRTHRNLRLSQVKAREGRRHTQLYCESCHNSFVLKASEPREVAGLRSGWECQARR